MGKKQLAIATAILVGIVAATSSLWAGLQDFTLKNRTGYQINYLYVSPQSSNQWGPDRLGSSQVVANGADAFITINGYPDNVCMFDIKAVDSDGDSYRKVANLCQVYDVTFTIGDLVSQ
ncbi:MAG: hypothetical protein KDK35_11080 [Leptospiraceae bacterium]|nr:hypothetical protein [Leptospiraceae bacterium]MCB1325765.1 hypothetical protein [Leptospiraceae bacterium]